MAIALIGLYQISAVLVFIVAVVGFTWLTAYLFRETVFMARVFDAVMPLSWVPNGVWNCMWKHWFMRTHRGRRYCAQSDVPEKGNYTNMARWDDIKLSVRCDGRTFPRQVEKRPPHLTREWLHRLKRQYKVIGLLVEIREDGDNVISFMGVGHKKITIEESVGPGLKMWANLQSIGVRKADSESRPFGGDRRKEGAIPTQPAFTGKDPLEKSETGSG